MKVNFKGILNTVSGFTSEHKPEIATGAGLVLMIAGAVGCVVATVKTMRAVADKKEDTLLSIAADTEEYENLTEDDQELYDYICEHPLPIKEVVKLSWKHWVFPIVSIAVGGVCIIFSDKEQARRIGIVTSALTSQIAEARDYKEAVKELVGKDKADEIEEEQTKKTARRRAREGDVIDTGTGDQYYEEYYSGALIKASPEYIQSCVNELNHCINVNCAKLGGDKRDKYDLAKFDSSLKFITVSEWCNILSMQIKTNGLTDIFGWDVMDGLVQLNYSNADCKMLDNNRSCIVLRFCRGNTPNYIDI